jgi:hypothetical protein
MSRLRDVSDTLALLDVSQRGAVPVLQGAPLGRANVSASRISPTSKVIVALSVVA